jgi:hypothetical protein
VFPTDEHETTEHASVEETLEYISDMLLSLEKMARRNDLQPLADRIEQAYDEARRRQTRKPS